MLNARNFCFKLKQHEWTKEVMNRVVTVVDIQYKCFLRKCRYKTKQSKV